MAIWPSAAWNSAELFPHQEEDVLQQLIEAKTYLVHRRPLVNLGVQEGRLRRQAEKDLNTHQALQQPGLLRARTRLNEAANSISLLPCMATSTNCWTRRRSGSYVNKVRCRGINDFERRIFIRVGDRPLVIRCFGLQCGSLCLPTLPGMGCWGRSRWEAVTPFLRAPDSAAAVTASAPSVARARRTWLRETSVG